MLLKLIFHITKTKTKFFMLFDESLACKLCGCVAYLAHLNDKVAIIIVDAIVLMLYDKCDRLCCYVLHSVEVVLLKNIKKEKKTTFCHIFIINFHDYRLGSHFLDVNYAKSLHS